LGLGTRASYFRNVAFVGSIISTKLCGSFTRQAT
jgi:hypothetical protein